MSVLVETDVVVHKTTQPARNTVYLQRPPTTPLGHRDRDSNMSKKSIENENKHVLGVLKKWIFGVNHE